MEYEALLLAIICCVFIVVIGPLLHLIYAKMFIVTKDISTLNERVAKVEERCNNNTQTDIVCAAQTVKTLCAAEQYCADCRLSKDHKCVCRSIDGKSPMHWDI